MSVSYKDTFEGHIYLDHDNPPVQWNIVRGLFSTPSTLEETEKRGAISMFMASRFSNSTAEHLKSELSIETIRLQHYSENVSRLAGIFVFDDLESLEELWNNNHWGVHFQDEYLADVGVTAYKSSRLDSNWVAEMIGHSGELLNGWESAAHNYWSGKSHPNKKPVWERIIDGHVAVWSMDSKAKALENIEAVWPQSLNILRYAINCASYGLYSGARKSVLDGQVFPHMFVQNGVIEVRYLLRMVHRGEQEFIDTLNTFMKSNPQYASSISCKGPEFLPDLTGFTTMIDRDSSNGFDEILDFPLKMSAKLNESDS